MNPAKLVMFSFRLALTNDEDDGFRKELTIKQIRSAARKSEEYQRIQSLYDDELEKILWQVDDWLGIYEDTESKTPRLIRTLIAKNSPEVYLLLMYLAKRNLNTSIELKASEIKALAFCLHWYGNNKAACVQEMFYRFKSGVNIQNLQKGISRLMHDCYLLHTYTPSEVRNFIKIEDSEQWRLWNTLPAEAREFFDRVFWYGTTEAKEMLLYAERGYLNTHFKNYDPAQQDMWAEYNRPWDYDHIIPRDWISGKWGPFREYDKSWLQSIGNMAAISYEANRSKSNSEEFTEYRLNEDKLLYFKEFEKLKSNITYDKGQSVIFAQTVYDRFCRIYECVFDLIYPVLNQITLSDTLQRRKDLILEIEGNLPNSKVYFAASDNNDHLLVREQDWAREWVGIGIIKGVFMVCFEWAGYMNNGEPKYIEVGIRKIPGTSVTYENLSLLKGKEINEGELNDWWYECETCKTLESSFIIGKMKEYLTKIPTQSE